ncbi:winged helix-turn-helix domain-containing protein [Ideonella sp. 4Y11]|uniref:Winged helix-turn-helix domain-containing protein n=1 Tax=Ideonella aquatica TaxID=2824119 RepID=A0A940YLD5_9BURK|nr:winged helix-turn-helix domain-containing protein [Ideonella aquatica]MBQ0959122.1 winged helix-turn-helix domain-containing protein [Ideonella aquatica]
MASTTCYSFGACQVQLERCQLLLAGQRQSVPPRVFDLLVYLIDHRDRVVTKDELLAKVWRGAEVSDSMIARTVMKARRAIGDPADAPVLIRTVHRLGYRFIGEVSCSQQPTEERPAQRLRLGLMPFVNATGRADLDWVGLGLAAWVARALDHDKRLAVNGPSTLTTALASVSSDGASTSREATAMALLGLHSLVHAELRTSGARLRLDYRTVGSRRLRGSLQGDDPVALGERLARALAAGLFPREPWPLPLAPRHALAAQAYAQALEMEQRLDWNAAAELLRGVLQLEPDSMAVRLLYLRMLANLGDPRAVAMGGELLVQAQAQAEPQLLAMVHHTLARVHFQRGDPSDLAHAGEHLAQALRLAAPHGDEEWVLRLYLETAIQHHAARELQRARRFYALARRGNERSGSPIRQAIILNNWAALELHSANPIAARELSADALSLCRQQAMHASALNALVNLAMADAALGLCGRATRHLEQGVGLIATLPDSAWDSPASLAAVAGDLALDNRQHGPLDQILEQLALRPSTAPLRAQVVLDFARAYREPRTEQAAATMRSSIAALRSRGHMLFAHALAGQLLRAQLRWQLCTDEMAAELATWPTLADDDELQCALVYLGAVARHAQGQIPATIKALQECLSRAPLCRWQARARLDLIWLHLEQGDLASTRVMVRDAGPWLAEHPMGRVVAARWALAHGQLDEAVDSLQAGLDGLDGPWPAELAALLPLWQSAQAAGRMPPQPAPAPRLLSQW